MTASSRHRVLLLVRVLVYLAAFVVPPVVLSVAGVKAALAERYAPPPPEAQPPARQPPATTAHDSAKPTAVVLLNPRGSEVTDVLAPFEVLAESGAFNVYLVAPEKVPATLSGGLEVLPQLSYADLDQTLAGQPPELVVVPAMWDVGSAEQRPVADWLRQHGPGARTLMSVCDGAEVLADAGLLEGRRATANWANLAKWQRRHPDTDWVRGRRYVEDGNVLTSAGVTSGTAAALHVVRRYVGDAAADRLTQEIGYPDTRSGEEPSIPADRLSPADRALYVLGGAYSWSDKLEVGVVLSSGPSEIELASAFDVYPGPAFTSTTTSLAADGSATPIRSEHGLLFIPRHGLQDAPPLDRLVAPGKDARAATGHAVASWASERGLQLEFVHADAPVGFPFDAALEGLARNANIPLASFTARLLEYPAGHLELVGPGWPVGWLFRPLATGLLGLLVVVALDRLVLIPALRRPRPVPPPLRSAS